MFVIISLLLSILSTLYWTNSMCELINDPSLKPEPFIVSGDAEILKKELYDNDAPNRDRDKVAKIIFHRTLSQRWEIRDFYNNYFKGKNRWGQTVCYSNLLDNLVDESTNSLENLYKVMFESFDGQLARILHESITGNWKEKGAVEEIVCANDKDIKEFIGKVYESVYQCKVEDHLKLFHQNDAAYQEVIHKYCWIPRCQEKKLKPEDIDKEVKSLQDIDAKKDKENFKKKLKQLLDNCCEPDLKEIFNKYKKGDHRISDGVDEAFDGDEKMAFNTLVRYIENTCMYYADELYHAVDGCGTDIDKINRIIVTRSERDLACVLKEYKNKRGETFTERLDEDTTEGRYLESIRYLCGKK